MTSAAPAAPNSARGEALKAGGLRVSLDVTTSGGAFEGCTDYARQNAGRCNSARIDTFKTPGGLVGTGGARPNTPEVRGGGMAQRDGRGGGQTLTREALDVFEMGVARHLANHRMEVHDELAQAREALLDDMGKVMHDQRTIKMMAQIEHKVDTLCSGRMNVDLSPVFSQTEHCERTLTAAFADFSVGVLRAHKENTEALRKEMAAWEQRQERAAEAHAARLLNAVEEQGRMLGKRIETSIGLQHNLSTSVEECTSEVREAHELNVQLKEEHRRAASKAVEERAEVVSVLGAFKVDFERMRVAQEAMAKDAARTAEDLRITREETMMHRSELLPALQVGLERQFEKHAPKVDLAPMMRQLKITQHILAYNFPQLLGEVGRIQQALNVDFVPPVDLRLFGFPSLVGDIREVACERPLAMLPPPPPHAPAPQPPSAPPPSAPPLLGGPPPGAALRRMNTTVADFCEDQDPGMGDTKSAPWRPAGQPRPNKSTSSKATSSVQALVGSRHVFGGSVGARRISAAPAAATSMSGSSSSSLSVVAAAWQAKATPDVGSAQGLGFRAGRGGSAEVQHLWDGGGGIGRAPSKADSFRTGHAAAASPDSSSPPSPVVGAGAAGTRLGDASPRAQSGGEGGARALPRDFSSIIFEALGTETLGSDLQDCFAIVPGLAVEEVVERRQEPLIAAVYRDAACEAGLDLPSGETPQAAGDAEGNRGAGLRRSVTEDYNGAVFRQVGLCSKVCSYVDPNTDLLERRALDQVLQSRSGVNYGRAAFPDGVVVRRRHYWTQTDSTRLVNTSCQTDEVVGRGARPRANGLKGEMQMLDAPKRKEVKKSFKTVLLDQEAMKQRAMAKMSRPQYNVHNLYYETGCVQRIAKSIVFEYTTLAVICLNAVWIAIDVDYNDADTLAEAHPVFQVGENFFCLYFSSELAIRFGAFSKKKKCFTDFWFVFDTVLVTLMMMETWVITVVVFSSGAGPSAGLGSMSMLRVFRLVKLARVSRVARLLRTVPELLILVKGLRAASRSVVVFFVMWTLIIYIYSLFLRMVDVFEEPSPVFTSIPVTMNILLLRGILPQHADFIMNASADNFLFWPILLSFIIVAFVMLMNMLVGVSVEVITAVASTEREGITVLQLATQLRGHLTELGLNCAEPFTPEELQSFLEDPNIASIIEGVGADMLAVVDLTNQFFEENEDIAGLSFLELVEVIMSLRGTNHAKVKDVKVMVRNMRSAIKDSEFNMRVIITEELHDIRNQVYEIMKAQMQLLEDHNNFAAEDDRMPRSSRTSLF
eukprot:CAMPEP_0203932672 /NCGR_PEP_ID=MMETSP0359-20131031/71021_1 /ASSEMBLY_ACC=CAM_ASM_000338 /TAXON_ID=268821 /ORGANISM="Scrippsiella Hangoei, Strain SHTV-5" /LENGTH=1278 /DNA_ID=CAMNT_0050862143 /DNA_START=42 /DNA_END=3878 /DNA_ORIENTATION=-